MKVNSKALPKSPFERDVLKYGGYQYTTNSKLSSFLANERFTTATLEIGDYKEKSVMDLGCGEGTYSIEIYERGKARELVGVDIAKEAIKVAKSKVGKRNIQFVANTQAELPFKDNRFDVAVIRGVLHHMDDPAQGIREAFRVAREVVVVDPNGYNIILKFIEKLSPYHREHDEKSFSSIRINGWLQQAGGTVVNKKWICLVPMFSPDWMAKFLKKIEPLVERIPIFKILACGSYVVRAVKQSESKS